MGKVLAKNITLKLGDKKIKGITDLDFGIQPEFEESENKESVVPSLDKIGGKTTFSVNLEFNENETGEESSYLDVHDLMQAADAGTEFAFAKGGTASTNKIVTGSCKITDYKDTSGSKGYATASISCQVTTALTFTTVA